MFQLIETIKIQNKKAVNLEYHQKRVDYSQKSLSLIDNKRPIILEKIINDFILENNIIDNSVHKCRVVYSNILISTEITKYIKKEIKTLKIVESNLIEYPFKFEDRKKINKLFERRAVADDILIVKNGIVTDTSFSNIIFYDPNFNDFGIWFTPASPLLKGTHRQYLLDNNVIKEKDITVSNLNGYSKFQLINSMINFGDVEININNILI